MAALTSRQSEILAFISQHIECRHYAPTVREIGEHFGIRSPNGVQCHLLALEAKGAIKRNRKAARGLSLPPCDGQLPFGGEVQ